VASLKPDNNKKDDNEIGHPRLSNPHASFVKGSIR